MKLDTIGPNCTELDFGDGLRVLFSYKTPVAYRKDGDCYITNRKWSNTTTRHINKWIGGDYGDARIVPQQQIDDVAGRAV